MLFVPVCEVPCEESSPRAWDTRSLLSILYEHYFFCLPYLPSRQPIYSLYHGYNYSYLMLTNFIGSSYMGDFLALYG